MEDDLRPEYDLKSLRVRKLGSGRKSFGGTTVHLEAAEENSPQRHILRRSSRRVEHKGNLYFRIFLLMHIILYVSA